MDGYNGFTNWETWNTYNWITNVEGIYLEVRHYSAAQLRDYVENYMLFAGIADDESSLRTDILSRALGAIDFDELAAAIADA